MSGGQLLGLSCGAIDGSAELLLKAALRAAEEAGAVVELVRLEELRLPGGPDDDDFDDGPWLWEKFVLCDALIVSTPIISRTLAARLKLFSDRMLGPNADAAMVEHLLAEQSAGRSPALPFRVDERVLKPRVAGFIAVGGSLTPQWKTLALPILHTTTFSMHMAVVDQVQFAGAGTPRSIVLDRPALERAARLGAHVASQIGRPFEAAAYGGDEPGLCPMCHLDVIVLRGREVECATCGARGELTDELQVRFTDLSTSVISMEEKRAHVREIFETAAAHRERQGEIEAAAREYDAYDRLVRPPMVAWSPAG